MEKNQFDDVKCAEQVRVVTCTGSILTNSGSVKNNAQFAYVAKHKTLYVLRVF